MEENKELIEETQEENAKAEVEAVDVEETIEESVETEEAVVEDEASEVVEAEDEIVSLQQAPVQKKSSKVLTQVIAAIVSFAVVIALTVFLTPRVKYMYAMSLANNGKADKAYKILCEIDGGYKKAEQALKRFIVVPAKVSNTEKNSSMGESTSTYTREIKTDKNSMTETLKNEAQSQITTTTYDKKGNVVKEEISQPESGSSYVCTYKYDKDGNRTHYLVESEGTKVYEAKYEYDKDGNCTYTSIFEMGYMGETTTETKNEDFKVYYIKSK